MDCEIEKPLLSVTHGPNCLELTSVCSRVTSRLQAQARRRIRAISNAPTLKECEELRDIYVAELIESGHRDAAETMLRDWESFGFCCKL